MTDSLSSSATAQTVALLTCYSFEIQNTAQEIVTQWLSRYSIAWVRLAVVEALYLGRYKAISVEHILSSWSRTGNPTIHFSNDFECLICRDLPRHLAVPLKPSANLKNERTSPPQVSFSLKQASQGKKATKAQASPPQIRTLASHKLQPKAPSVQASAPLDLHKNSPSDDASERSIDQFTPSLEASEFYFKLKAVAQSPVKQ